MESADIPSESLESALLICHKVPRDTRSKLRPETIENRWDILYKEYPEVYDEFAGVPYKPDWVAFLGKILKIDWTGKTVVDVGSGSGLSTFDLAQRAKFVIGVEPNDAMRELAVKNAGKRNAKNVRFVKGWANRIPLEADSADVVVAFTASLDYEESARIVREGRIYYLNRCCTKVVWWRVGSHYFRKEESP